MNSRAPLPILIPLVVVALGACSDVDRRPAPEPSEETASPARTDPAVETVGGVAAARTDVHGVVADLLAAEREGGRLTVSVRFRNTTEATHRIEIEGDYDERWRLEAGGRRWSLMREPEGDLDATDPPRRALKPGQSALWRGTFEAPPPEVTTFRLEVPGVRPFEEVPITDG